MTPGALARLVRLPAALTVPGDTWAGAAAAAHPLGARAHLLPLASVPLYWAGMALNDWADRDLDRRERPERPIPSGEITPGQALATAGALTAAGLAAAAAVGGTRALRVAAPLAAAVWAYDLLLKDTVAGPAAMAATRTLDVLLGAGGSPAAVPAAALVGLHTLGVTGLSRGEVHGGSTPVGAAVLAGTAACAALATGRRPSPTALALGATYAWTVGRPQVDALRSPDAGRVRAAVGAGIVGMVPLQACLVARHGSPRLGAALMGLAASARVLTRKVSAT